jgi:hypothetical protein
MPLTSGDVVIKQRTGASVCAYAVVLDDGVMPPTWHTGTRAQANEWAATTLIETGGILYVIDQDDLPQGGV